MFQFDSIYNIHKGDKTPLIYLVESLDKEILIERTKIS